MSSLSSNYATPQLFNGFLAVLVVVFGVAFATTGLKSLRSATIGGGPNAFKAFQRNFLIIYLIMMAADWMQGPYVYRLYSYYGFSRHDNGVLFIVGFGSSLVFGTWSGPLADRYGRKLCCILYGITYILSCLTKFVNDYNVLMVGRLLGGFATSILWSAFESWMVSEHVSRGFDPSLIGSTFSLMITLNGVVAIASGFLSEYVVAYFGDHPVAPFGASAVFLAIGTVLIFFQWTENFGERTGDMLLKMKESVRIVKEDHNIFLVGFQQAVFEGAMYTFVFMWSPALEPSEADIVAGAPPIPYGIIFACFMLACSLGSTIFGFTEKLVPMPVLLRNVFMLATASMAVPILFESRGLRMASFIAFEGCVGMFWPSIGTLRSIFLPESHRATIINVFRIPLNIIVCMVLFFQGGMSVSTVFIICTSFHAIAVVAANQLAKGYKDHLKEKVDSPAQVAGQH